MEESVTRTSNLLPYATQFTFTDRLGQPVNLVVRNREKTAWAIKHGIDGMLFTIEGRWTHDTPPNSRPEQLKRLTEWPSAQEA